MSELQAAASAGAVRQRQVPRCPPPSTPWPLRGHLVAVYGLLQPGQRAVRLAALGLQIVELSLLRG